MARHTVRLDHRTVEFDDSRFDITCIGDGAYVVDDGSRQYRVTVAGPPEDRWVFVDGRVARLEIAAAGRSRPRGRAGAHDMAAPMPATVVKILVELGAPVAKDDTLLMLEAMKMELAIRASRPGIVRAINCQPGELVQPGVPLVEIEG